MKKKLKPPEQLKTDAVSNPISRPRDSRAYIDITIEYKNN